MATESKITSALVLTQMILQWTTELSKMAALLKASHENGGTGLTDTDIERLFEEDDFAKARAQAAIEFLRTGTPASPAPDAEPKAE